MKTITKLWVLIIILIILAPLGLVLPAYFKAGAAWGEWGADEIEKLVGYIPRGLERLSELWKAPLPDYAFKGWEDKPMLHMGFAYVACAVIGIGIIAGVIFLMGKFLAKKD